MAQHTDPVRFHSTNNGQISLLVPSTDGRRTPCRTYSAPAVPWTSYRPVSPALSDDDDDEDSDKDNDGQSACIPSPSPLSAASTPQGLEERRQNHVSRPILHDIETPQLPIIRPLSRLSLSPSSTTSTLVACPSRCPTPYPPGSIRPDFFSSPPCALDSEFSFDLASDADVDADATTLAGTDVDFLPALTRCYTPGTIGSLPLRCPLPPSPGPGCVSWSAGSLGAAQTQTHARESDRENEGNREEQKKNKHASRFIEHISLNSPSSLYTLAQSVPSTTRFRVGCDGNVRFVAMQGFGNGFENGLLACGHGDDEEEEEDKRNTEERQRDAEYEELVRKVMERKKEKAWRARVKRGVLEFVCCGKRE